MGISCELLQDSYKLHLTQALAMVGSKAVVRVAGTTVLVGMVVGKAVDKLLACTQAVRRVLLVGMVFHTLARKILALRQNLGQIQT